MPRILEILGMASWLRSAVSFSGAPEQSLAQSQAMPDRLTSVWAIRVQKPLRLLENPTVGKAPTVATRGPSSDTLSPAREPLNEEPGDDNPQHKGVQGISFRELHDAVH